MRITKTYFMMPVADMSRAIEFYKSAFDLDLMFDTPEWTEFVCGDNVSLALHSGMHGALDAGLESGLGFQVENLEEACSVVQASGGRVLHDPQDRPGEPIRLAIVMDTEGNKISLAEPLG